MIQLLVSNYSKLQLNFVLKDVLLDIIFCLATLMRKFEALLVTIASTLN